MKTLGRFLCLACAVAQAQQPVFRDEAREVSIDAIVTAKNGEPVPDLTAKNFRVWEDDKQQAITSFTQEKAPSDSEPGRFVLFFDDAGMRTGEQVSARQAAARFIDANAGPTRLIAVVMFDGGFRVAQNFTGDAARLKQALNGLRSNTPNPREIEAQATAANARNLIASLGNLAQNLNSAPGRKTIVLFDGSASFTGVDAISATALARICNRSNVGVYPEAAVEIPDDNTSSGPVGPVRPRVARPVTRISDSSQPDANVPATLASETGGFVLPVTNDLTRELQKVAAEQNQRYVLGYTPPDSKEGSCHKLRVKVDRSRTIVRVRSDYCTAKPRDLLAESRIERDLEKQAGATATAGPAAEIAAPFFYVGPGVARVDISIKIPVGALKFDRVKGKLHAELNVLGIATASDGTVAARFSDIVRRDFDSEQAAESFKQKPLDYEKEFKIAPGAYQLVVVFGAGGTNFGKAEAPLMIDAYGANQFALSAIVLSRQAQPVADLGLAASLTGEATPLIAGGVQIVPSASNIFMRGEQGFCYFEIYTPPNMDLAAAVDLRILDAATGAVAWDGGAEKIERSTGGKSATPIGLRIPIAGLPPGPYRLEVTASDGPEKTIGRASKFEVR